MPHALYTIVMVITEMTYWFSNEDAISFCSSQYRALSLRISWPRFTFRKNAIFYIEAGIIIDADEV